MLSKKQRLTTDAFKRFFSVGTRVHAPTMQLIYHTHPELHVSVVVPKKVEKRAVERNKLRRKVYNIMRETKEVGVFIFILKNKVHTCTQVELQKTIRRLITEAMNKK